MTFTTINRGAKLPAKSYARFKYNARPWVVWGTSAVFVFFQFFLQLSVGVMINSLMHSFAISALAASVLASCYYYVYAVLQTPAGMMIDRYGPRHLLTFGSLIVALGCLLFAITNHFYVAILGRILMGGGSAFAFVGSLYLIRNWFPVKRFSVMVGLAETLGMIGTVIGTLALAAVIAHFGWRSSMLVAAGIAAAISIACWTIIRDNPRRRFAKKYQTTTFKQRLMLVVSNPVAWLNGLYNGLQYSTITVFVALWGIPFLMLNNHVSLPLATAASVMVFLGAAVGSPIVGYLSEKTRCRKPYLVAGSLSSMLLMLLILAIPSIPLVMMFVILFILGLACSPYMLNFAIADDIAPPEAKNTYVGFTNALGIASIPILQPLVGWVLDLLANHHHLGAANRFDLSDYRVALLLIPTVLLIAAVIAVRMPETHPEHKRALALPANTEPEEALSGLGLRGRLA